MTYDRRIVDLAQPFPNEFIHGNPSGGGSYVKHHVVEQRLIQVFGTPPRFEMVQVIRGDVAEIPPNPNGKSQRAKAGSPALTNVVVGVIARLTVSMDGRELVAEEAGDCEEPHNWKTDGARLKDAMSDAYKRCAMRLGCGLHLWSQDEYFLHTELLKDQAGTPTSVPAETPASPSPSGESAPVSRDPATVAEGGEHPPSSPPSSGSELDPAPFLSVLYQAVGEKWPDSAGKPLNEPRVLFKLNAINRELDKPVVTEFSRIEHADPEVLRRTCQELGLETQGQLV